MSLTKQTAKQMSVINSDKRNVSKISQRFRVNEEEGKFIVSEYDCDLSRVSQ